MTTPNAFSSPNAETGLGAAEHTPVHVSQSAGATALLDAAPTECRPPFAPGAGRKLKESRNVYVSAIPSHWTGVHLSDLFSRFGVVLSTRVCARPGGVPFGFALMEDPAAAQAAIRALHGSMTEGQRLEVRIATRKSPPDSHDSGSNIAAAVSQVKPAPHVARVPAAPSTLPTAPFFDMPTTATMMMPPQHQWGHPVVTGIPPPPPPPPASFVVPPMHPQSTLQAYQMLMQAAAQQQQLHMHQQQQQQALLQQLQAQLMINSMTYPTPYGAHPPPFAPPLGSVVPGTHLDPNQVMLQLLMAQQHATSANQPPLHPGPTHLAPSGAPPQPAGTYSTLPSPLPVLDQHRFHTFGPQPHYLAPNVAHPGPHDASGR